MERMGAPGDRFVTEARERMERQTTRHQVSTSRMSESAEKEYRH